MIIKIITLTFLSLSLGSCALFSTNKLVNSTKNENLIMLTNEIPPDSELIKNESYVEYKIPIEEIEKLIEKNNNDSVRQLAIQIKITPKKIEEIRNFLTAYKSYLESEKKWEYFLYQINTNGNINIKINTSFKKNGNYFYSYSNFSSKKNLNDLFESEMYQQRDLSNFLEGVFYEKNLGYINFEGIDSFFPSNDKYNGISYFVAKDMVNGKEAITPHLIANQLLKIKDKNYFINFMNHFKIDSSKINKALEKQRIIDSHNELYYENNSIYIEYRNVKRYNKDKFNNYQTSIPGIPLIIDPDTGIEITPTKFRSILSNGDVVVLKTQQDWKEFFYFWKHAAIFDEDKYENTKKYFFDGVDSFDIKAMISSNFIKSGIGSVQGSGYEALSSYAHSIIIKVFSPITDSRTIVKAMNFARNRYIDNNFGYMVPLISSNLWGDSFNLEEVYKKTYCSLMIDRIYKIAGLNVTRDYEISGLISPGDINAAGYDFYISYSILGILPNVLPKKIIKPTLRQKFIGYNRYVTDIVEKKQAMQEYHGKSCNFTNFWCTIS